MGRLVDLFFIDFKEILDKVHHKTQLKTPVSLDYSFLCNWKAGSWRRFKGPSLTMARFRNGTILAEKGWGYSCDEN